jgi:hypothetical protein
MSGQIGYEAYRAHTGGVSLATGQSIPEWQHLKPEIQAAWDAAGTALRADLEVAQKRIADLEAERDSLAAALEVAKQDAFETWRHDQGADDSLEAYEYFLREAEYPLADAFFGPHASVLAARDRHVREQVIDALLAEVAGREHPIPEYDPWCRGGAHGINHERARLRAILLAAKEASGQ